MLHDPRHDRTPSLAGFALFVASKDPDETYDWSNCRECAVGQYLASIGREDIQLKYWKRDLAKADLLACGAHTFGQLADRILAHQMAA